MGRKRGRFEAREVNETRETEKREVDRDSGEEADETEVAKVFFSCYLLRSLSPRHKGRTYIGFTVNPQRRIKQHNGEKRCGALRTKHGRPWEMVLCIYGFPSNIAALQFEWAWQHPTKSLAVRQAASSFKSLSGLANKIKLAYTMLTLPSWENLSLTVNFLSTKYTKHIAGCPKLPNQMRFNICSMDDLPCYVEGHNLQCSNDDFDEDDGENLASYDCEQPLQIEEPQNLPESSKSTEEYYGNLSYSSIILPQELSEFSDLSQSPKRVIESRRRASTSLSPNSCGENDEMEQVRLKSTPRSSDNSSRILLQELSEFRDLSQSPKRVIETRRASTRLSPNSCGENDEMEQVRLKSTPRNSDNEGITDRFVLSPEIDMINLCTPSSGIIRSKTKRALFDSMIIDLTDSPMVIQL